MKKLMIAAAGAVAIGFSAVAADWFNGGIAEGWPNSTSMSGGEWTVQAGGTYNEGVLEVTAPTNAPVTFTSSLTNKIADITSATFTSTVTFTPFPSDEKPPVPEGAKAGAIVVKNGDNLNYYVLANDGMGGPNDWAIADEATVVEGPVEVTIRLTEGSATYYFGSDKNIAEKYYNPGNGELSAACYAGDGAVSSLSATYEKSAPAVETVTFTLSPTIAGATVAVYTNDIAVAAGESGYTVLKGAEVSIVYTAANGKLFADGTNTKTLTKIVNSDGSISVEGEVDEPTDAKAKIGTTLYLTLNEAFEAAVDYDTVYLLADMTESITLPAKRITFDFQKRTITTKGTSLILQTGSHIALSGKDAKVTSTGNVAIGFKTGADGASFTVDTGVYMGREGAVLFGLAKNCTATINGGNFEATDNAVFAGNGTVDCGGNTLTIKNAQIVGGIKTEGYIACGIYWPCSGTVTVESTEIGLAKTGGCGICARAGTVKVGEKVTINLGEEEPVEGWIGDAKNVVPGVPVYFDYDAAYPGYAAGDAIKSVTKFDTAKGQIWFPADKDGYYTLGKQSDAEAKIGTQYYLTLNDAAAAAKDGETITLLADVADAQAKFENAVAVTLDLNGKTFCCATPKDPNNWYGFTIRVYKGTLTIVDSVGGGKVVNANDDSALRCCAGSDDFESQPKVIGKGGVFENCSKSESTVYAGAGTAQYGTIVIENATVQNTHDGTFDWGNASRILNVGNMNPAGYGAISIKGGTYQVDPTLGDDNLGGSYVAEGYYSVKQGDVWKVVDSVEAKIGTQYYLTLNDALEAAVDGNTVTLCKDITTAATAAIKINKDITLDFATFTVTKTVANDYTFDIPNGKTVIFKGTTGGVTQTASNLNPDWPASMIRNKGNLTIEGGVYTSDFCIIKNDEDPGAGVLTVNGGTFNVLQTEGGYTGFQSALMNWAAATINGGIWNGAINTRSSDNNAASKSGTTVITKALEGTATYVLTVGYDGDTTYANVPKIKGVALANVELKKVATIADELELVQDGDYVTAQKKAAPAPAPVTPGTEIVVPTGKTTEDFCNDITTNVAVKAQYLKAPGGVETLGTYLDLFEAVPSATAGKVEFVLSEDATEFLQKAANVQVAAALDDSAIVTIPGLYYTYVGGTDVTGITTAGAKTLATTTETTVPKPELGATDKAFYQLKIEVK